MVKMWSKVKEHIKIFHNMMYLYGSKYKIMLSTKIFTSICFLFFGICQLGITQESNTLEPLPLEVKVTKDIQKVYIHTLQPKETLYRLSRIFDLPVAYLEEINRIEKGNVLAIGSEIIIPIKDRLIKTQRTHPHDTPVVYQVKQRETIFRIARIYFDKQIEDIQNLNNLDELQLDIDQQLQVGWIDLRDPLEVNETTESEVSVTVTSTDSTVTIVKSTASETIVETLIQIDSLIDNRPVFVSTLDSAEVKLDMEVDSLVVTVSDIDSIAIVPEKPSKPVGIATYKRGVAYWNKSSTSKDLFVMHDTAKPNTQIELYNPLVNKRIIATVVAPIPRNAYPDDISLVLSPGVAAKLGARDSRFYVEMKYYK